MKIEVRKHYKTRRGNKVFISTVISNEPLFKYYGVFETGNNKGHGQHYTERGCVSLTRESALDIVDRGTAMDASQAAIIQTLKQF